MTRIIITTATSRPRPRAGDTRRTKRHGLQIRVQRMGRDMAGRPIGRLVSNGRPVYGWRRPAELDQWDQHLLQRPELAARLAQVVELRPAAGVAAGDPQEASRIFLSPSSWSRSQVAPPTRSNVSRC